MGPSMRFAWVDAHEKTFKGLVELPFRVWTTAEPTIGDLEEKLASQTGLRVAYITYRGVRMRKECAIATLIPDLHGGSRPRFCVHTTTGEDVFFVRSLPGTSVMVDLPLDTSTVRELKEEIEALEKIPAEHQVFVYNGRYLADVEPVTKTLREYGVKRDSNVVLLSRLRGGGAGLDVPTPTIEFPDLENRSAIIVKPWSTNVEPHWLNVGKGLNLEGLCTNKACLAYSKDVVCKMGFTAVNLVATTTGACPACKQSVRVETCSFTDCLWMFEGRKALPQPRLQAPPQPRLQAPPQPRLPRFLTGLAICFRGKPPAPEEIPEEKTPAPEEIPEEKQPNRDIVSPWYKASTLYEYFRKTDMVRWESLIVAAKKIPTVAKDGPDATIPLDRACSVCFQSFHSGDGTTHTTACGHVFHVACLEGWLSCSGTGCPVCRADIVVEQ